MVGVGVDFPGWILNRLDAKAETLGISLQASVNIWIAEKCKKHHNELLDLFHIFAFKIGKDLSWKV